MIMSKKDREKEREEVKTLRSYWKRRIVWLESFKFHAVNCLAKIGEK